MSSTRPLTVSLPLGLFSSANMTRLTTVASPERLPTNLILHRELLDMPTVTPEMDGLDDSRSWDEE